MEAYRHKILFLYIVSCKVFCREGCVHKKSAGGQTDQAAISECILTADIWSEGERLKYPVNRLVKVILGFPSSVAPNGRSNRKIVLFGSKQKNVSFSSRSFFRDSERSLREELRILG